MKSLNHTKIVTITIVLFAGAILPAVFLNGITVFADEALDSDGDGISDLQDQCPLEKEDVNDIDDYDGCIDSTQVSAAASAPEVPLVDSDGDGISDLQDQCADEKENVNDFEDYDGCSDTAPKVTTPEPIVTTQANANSKTTAAYVDVCSDISENDILLLNIIGCYTETESATPQANANSKSAEYIEECYKLATGEIESSDLCGSTDPNVPRSAEYIEECYKLATGEIESSDLCSDTSTSADAQQSPDISKTPAEAEEQ